MGEGERRSRGQHWRGLWVIILQEILILLATNSVGLEIDGYNLYQNGCHWICGFESVSATTSSLKTSPHHLSILPLPLKKKKRKTEKMNRAVPMFPLGLAYISAPSQKYSTTSSIHNQVSPKSLRDQPSDGHRAHSNSRPVTVVKKSFSNSSYPKVTAMNSAPDEFTKKNRVQRRRPRGRVRAK